MPLHDLQSREMAAYSFCVPTEFCWFEVNERGQINLAKVYEPKVREDVYPSIARAEPRSVDELQTLIESCTPLSSYFVRLASIKRQVLERQLEENQGLNVLSPCELVRAQQLHELLVADPDGGWWNWIATVGEEGVYVFQEHIDVWIQEEIDWNEVDFFEVAYNDQSSAFDLFSSLGVAVLNALGVRLIQGQCPGSSYCAAVLLVEPEAANAEASQLGLSYRFRKSQEANFAPPGVALPFALGGGHAA